MAKFVYTGEEYLNADHIVSIDTYPSQTTIWICLDNGVKLPRSNKYLPDILRMVNGSSNGDGGGLERCR